MGPDPRTRKIIRQCLMAVALLSVASCLPDGETTPTALRIGVLPDQDALVLQRRYAPLVAHLNTQLKMDVELVVPETYKDLVRQFGGREIDLAFFGGTTFVASMIQHDAVPLVMRDIDVEFSTYFIAAKASPALKLEDFRGQRFSFGAKTSTSGHLMPRLFMQQNGIKPESFFSQVGYSGSHDATVQLVLDGSVELGAANAEVVSSMLQDGRLKPAEVRVVWETPPYADYVWAVQSDLDANTRGRLQDVFLSLSPLNEAGARILKPMGASGFLPARREDFASLRKIMADLPMFREMTEKSDR